MTVSAAVLVAGFLDAAIGIWASILWGVSSLSASLSTSASGRQAPSESSSGSSMRRMIHVRATSLRKEWGAMSTHNPDSPPTQAPRDPGSQRRGRPATTLAFPQSP